ncbi:MAG: hypothetical protein RLZZ627_490 [Pseudomonadota bacterium]|jgi:hypothetical protein
MFTENIKQQITRGGVLLSLLMSIHSLWEESRLSERLTLVTPIVVLDRAALLKSLPVTASIEERERVTQRLKALASQYANEGYLVIDGGWVLAGPKDVYVR